MKYTETRRNQLALKLEAAWRDLCIAMATKASHRAETARWRKASKEYTEYTSQKA